MLAHSLIIFCIFILGICDFSLRSDSRGLGRKPQSLAIGTQTPIDGFQHSTVLFQQLIEIVKLSVWEYLCIARWGSCLARGIFLLPRRDYSSRTAAFQLARGFLVGLHQPSLSFGAWLAILAASTIIPCL